MKTSFHVLRRLSSPLRRLALIHVLLCALFCSFDSRAAASYDVGRDFSLNSNPNGAWAYGYETSLGGAFVVLTVPVTQPADNGVQVLSWQLTRFSEPAVFANET